MTQPITGAALPDPARLYGEGCYHEAQEATLAQLRRQPTQGQD